MNIKKIANVGLVFCTALLLTGCAFSGSPLYKASLKGKTNDVKTLLNNGAVVDERGGYGFTPLWMAARYGHADIAQMLIAKGADVDDAKNFLKLCPLAVAVTYQHVDVVKVLLDNGANPNALASTLDKAEVLAPGNSPVPENTGLTVLMLAADHGDTEIVEALLASGAKVNGVNMTAGIAKQEYLSNIEINRSTTTLTFRQEIILGPTALTYAKEKNHARVIALLEQHGGKECRSK